MTNFENTVQALHDGEVIAYPTEGVFGVGCDPDNADAIQKLLELKKRPVEKGLILIAANFEQLKPYIDESQLTDEARQAVFDTWPGPVTWVMPAKPGLSNLLSGQFDSIAVRVTDHPLVQKLCESFGKPLTSTSANLTGEPPCMTFQEVHAQLGEYLVAILEGETGGRDKPSEIRDALTSTILRQG
ncbi:L-threonylcarbamoyladenylate synthase [Vibrio penaeicida]|uniref:L-threonylcarbamoyladenylate synthase n=1 Tax=Vibrio penaeicida TaxID=104609 RepID=UPI00273453DA|nr:L-threonylcarbamoyladenylate synthase [Vibrio penaeicida]MDP2574968.1 L-threonylcarbamoyladenylate synthase [Vibrio penaeicida]